jgi:hypothetical protein
MATLECAFPNPIPLSSFPAQLQAPAAARVCIPADSVRAFASYAATVSRLQ